MKTRFEKLSIEVLEVVKTRVLFIHFKKEIIYFYSVFDKKNLSVKVYSEDKEHLAYKKLIGE